MNAGEEVLTGSEVTAQAVKPSSGGATWIADQAFIAAIPHAFARLHLLIAVRRAQTLDGDVEQSIVLLHGSSTDPLARRNAVAWTGNHGWPYAVGNDDDVAAIIDAAYEARQRTAQRPTSQSSAGQPLSGGSFAEDTGAHDDAEDLNRLLAEAERDLLASDGKAPIVRLVDYLMFRAVHLGASDLHIQAMRNEVVVRHRIDGVIVDSDRLPLRLLTPVVSRIKVIGRMDVAESLIPQDGRTTVTVAGRSIDVRISTLPTPQGERVVLRLLDGARSLHDFAGLGMPEHIAYPFLDLARRDNGIILVTGPTGAGKTTTLYATLRELGQRDAASNIMTIEDPIEYELDGLGLPISQSQVNDKKGVTFATGLRHILRQDPDIILVGEIRDADTARMAIQSSLTGHLVFSTLHTNDAAKAVTRLFDLGVEPYLVASSLSGVLAQRLVRTYHSDCAGRGCAGCMNSGFKGRRGIFELLTVTPALRNAISASANLDVIRQTAIAGGMVTLADAGRAMVAAGATAASEVERVVHG